MDSAAIAKPMSEVPAWHAVAADEVLRQLNTDPKKGLDTNEVSQRLSKYGLNRLRAVAATSRRLVSFLQWRSASIREK